MNEELQSMNDELQLSGEAQREQQEQFGRLNQFMSLVLGSMPSGVDVVDHELTVRTWNARAEDLWGVRREEAEGERLFDLDIGLPLDALRPPLHRQLDGDGSAAHDVVTVPAVNRRGRPITVQVTVTRLTEDRDTAPGVILMMDVVEGE